MIRRLEHALVRRDVRMIDDPMRSQTNALAVGAVLAVVILAGCAIWGMIRPQGAIGDSVIVVGKSSGATYVVVSGRLHPVLNLASARLITGRSDSPRSVADNKLGSYPRGPLLGIPGAPSALPGAGEAARAWTVCDEADGSSGAAGSVRLSVIAAPPEAAGGAAPAGRRSALLISYADTTYLVYRSEGEGSAVRARVDMNSAEVRSVLHLDGIEPRPVSAGLIALFPEVPPIEVPPIPGKGRKGVITDPGVGVGSVVRSVAVNDVVSYYLVLADAIQKVGPVAAEILRTVDLRGSGAVTTVAPARIAALPTTTAVAVNDFPAAVPIIASAESRPVVCQSWLPAVDGGAARMTLLLGSAPPVPAGGVPVPVAGADGGGPAVDSVYLRPGSGESVIVTGIEPRSARAQSRYYIGDSGVRFGLPDQQVASVLGLSAEPVPVPWPIISLLPVGPTLSRSAALVAHDGLGQG
jgi:type VII secretion protein EccB